MHIFRARSFPPLPSFAYPEMPILFRETDRKIMRCVAATVKFDKTSSDVVMRFNISSALHGDYGISFSNALTTVPIDTNDCDVASFLNVQQLIRTGCEYHWRLTVECFLTLQTYTLSHIFVRTKYDKVFYILI